MRISSAWVKKIQVERRTQMTKVCRFNFVKGAEGRPEFPFMKIPTKATRSAAGFDFVTPISLEIFPGQVIIVPTGVKCLLAREVLLIVPRSSVGIKKQVALPNAVGVIDADYYENQDNDGEIMLALRNDSRCDRVVFEAGDRVAQGIIIKLSDDWCAFEVERDSEGNERQRKGGIGSTGV